MLAEVEKVIVKEKEYMDKLGKAHVFGNGEGAEELGDEMETEEAVKKADEILSAYGTKKEEAK